MRTDLLTTHHHHHQHHSRSVISRKHIMPMFNNGNTNNYVSMPDVWESTSEWMIDCQTTSRLHIVQLEITPTPLKICWMLILFLPHLLYAILLNVLCRWVIRKQNFYSNWLKKHERYCVCVFVLWNNIYPYTNWLYVFIGSMCRDYDLTIVLRKFSDSVSLLVWYVCVYLLACVLFSLIFIYLLLFTFSPLPVSNERYMLYKMFMYTKWWCWYCASA